MAKNTGQLKPRRKIYSDDYGSDPPLPTYVSRKPSLSFKPDVDQQRFLDAILDPNNIVIFCNDRAGTGKTTLGVAAAKVLVQSGVCDELVYIIAPCEEKTLGYMPGDVASKISIYGMPLEQALIECGEQPERAIIQNGLAGEKNGAWVRLMPSTFLRGGNLKRKVVMIEEAQNYAFSELKKTITRVHDSSKLIVIGHDGQRDAFKTGRSAFSQYLGHFEGNPGVAVCSLKTNYRGWISNHADSLEPEI